ncbi:MAG: hypothetical protein MK193_05000 [Lentisphaeria bacterium]|nr:hypothetical protein [Lentisphaeria bacterium]
MSDFNNTEGLFADRDRAEEICSMLLANGYTKINDFRDLVYDVELRQDVEKRLNKVGMRLIYNMYSEYWGVGLNEHTSKDDRLEWSSNFGLSRGAMALFLILWCKLILPKRLEQEAQNSEDDGILGDAFLEFLEVKPVPNASISREQVTAEFASLLGGVTNTSKYLTQLNRASLIKMHGGVIEEGPLMSLVIDEASLGDELRREVLLSVLRRSHRHDLEEREKQREQNDADLDDDFSEVSDV